MLVLTDEIKNWQSYVNHNVFYDFSLLVFEFYLYVKASFKQLLSKVLVFFVPFHGTF